MRAIRSPIYSLYTQYYICTTCCMLFVWVLCAALSSVLVDVNLLAPVQSTLEWSHSCGSCYRTLQRGMTAKGSLGNFARPRCSRSDYFQIFVSRKSIRLNKCYQQRASSKIIKPQRFIKKHSFTPTKVNHTSICGGVMSLFPVQLAVRPRVFSFVRICQRVDRIIYATICSKCHLAMSVGGKVLEFVLLM